MSVINQSIIVDTTKQRWRIAASVLIALTIGVRLINLGADPPIGLSVGQGIYTDPGSYTNFARHAQLFNDPNPFEDDRFPLFEHSAVAYLARPVFELFGYGQAQGELVALLFSISTILLMFLIVRRAAGIEAGVFMLMFLLLNQNQFHYGRLPFLEHAMIFFGVLTLWALHNLRRSPHSALVAGIVMPCAFLIGKAHGLVFVAVFAAYFLWLMAIKPEAEHSGPLNELKTRILPFAGGAALTCILWYATIGHESLPTIIRYVREQSTGIYGAPQAFTSFKDFYWSFVSLGSSSRLWQRMPETSIVSFVVLATFIYAWVRNRGKLPLERVFGEGTVVFLAWMTFFYLALFGWNYQPFRYQLALVYPACALGGIGISALWKRAREPASKVAPVPPRGFSIRYLVFYLALLGILSVVAFDVYFQRLRALNMHFNFAEHMPWVVFGATLATLTTLSVDLWRRRRPYKRINSHLLPVIAWLLPLFSATVGGWWYKDWLFRPTYTMQAISLDLPKILGPEAVVSGTYGVALCQDNEIPALTHMFGVADPDTTFFERFPVTHLLLDVPSRNMFQKLHPEVSRQAVTLHRYNVTNRGVDLIRVAGGTGNQRADAYSLSAFERGQLVLGGKLRDPTGSSIRELMNMDSSNLAVNLYMGARSERDSAFLDARFFYQCAVEASPTDFNLRAELGRLYFDLYQMTGDPLYRQSALIEFREAHRLNPGSSRVETALLEVEESS
ncbi:MAG: ArnT family glycosyltransferase [Candidatus Zixiibacteriota bacterium]